MLSWFSKQCEKLEKSEYTKLTGVIKRIGKTTPPNTGINYNYLLQAFLIEEGLECGHRMLYNAIDTKNVEENTDIQDNNNEISDGKESDVIRGQIKIIDPEYVKLKEEEAVTNILNQEKYITLAKQHIKRIESKSKSTISQRINNIRKNVNPYGFLLGTHGGRKSRKSRKFRKSRKSRKSRKTRK